MSIANLKSKSEKTKKIVAGLLSIVVVLIIVVAGIFWYEAPYKKTKPETDHSISSFKNLKGLFSKATQEAQTTVDFVDGAFEIQQ